MSRLDRYAMVALLVVGVAWIGGAIWQIRVLGPPDDVTDLATFAERMGEPRRLAIVGGADDPTIVWIGGRAGLSIASGPACYVFDRTGRLTSWSWETGDGQSTDRLAGLAYDVEPASLAEAIAVTQQFARNE